MKRVVTADIFGNSHVNMIMSQMALFFSNFAVKHIPDVEIELNSFNAYNGKLTWYGDMTYNKDNQPLTLSIPGQIAEDMSFDEFRSKYFRNIMEEYIRQLELTYGENAVDIH